MNPSRALCCRVFRLFVLSVVFSNQIAAADELPKDETAKIEELIEALASTNKVETLKSNGKTLSYPPDWDAKAQVSVSKAASALVEMKETAFSQLVAHADDKRFSFIETSGNGAMSERPVGVACRRIMETQLDVFEQIGIYPRMYPSYFDEVANDKNKIKEWWDERKGQSLVELQIESIEWAIEQQSRLLTKWQTDPEIERDDRTRLRTIVAKNETLLKKLRRTQKPIEHSGHPFRMYEGK